MIPSFWIKSMETVGLEPRETYEELIENLKELEMSFPEESPKKEQAKSNFFEKNEIPPSSQHI